MDAAWPPSAAPEGVSAVLGYVGGSRASHVWTPGQWRPFAHLRQFPVVVPDITRAPGPQALEAVQAVKLLGWSDEMSGAEQRAIIFDLEDQANAAWYVEAARLVLEHGFMPVVYGSMSTVLTNAASDVLVAEWDDKAVIPPGQTIHGKQDQANVDFMSTVVDYSVLDDWLYHRGGVGARHGA
jgi:hypothetical protein